MVSPIICAKKVRGATHKKNNIPCQDSFGYECTDSAVILAVADGHGSAKHFRSDRGSRLAVEAAISCCKEYADVFASEENNVIKEIGENRFVKDLIRQWQRLVLKDAADDPFSKEESDKAGIACNTAELGIIDNIDEASLLKIAKVYGTTLLIVAVLADKVLAWQVGDGDILFYNPIYGAKAAVEDDPHLFANETTSLCGKSAFADFRFRIQNTYEKETTPSLIMLSTDGFRNSFLSTEHYVQAAADYYKLLEDEGIEAVDSNMEQWLDETSAEGSGDDITLLLVWNQ